jgi:hypothetical protein
MNQRTRRGVVLIVCILVICLSKFVFASAQQVYVLQRSTISSASNVAIQGNGYALVAVAGQPVVGSSSGAGYQASGGYPPVVPVSPPQTIYLPVVKK